MLKDGLKQKTLEEKIQILRDYLNNENSDDKLLALNVFLLVKRNNNFDDSFFTHEDVLFNDIMEFIDVADGLHVELENFLEKMLGIYLSCIYNCHILEPNTTIPTPKIYLHVLYMMDFLTLSSLLKNFEAKKDDNIYDESYSIIVNLANKISYLNVLLSDNPIDVGE